MVRKRSQFEYDVALSFAGEDRAIAKKLYDLLERGDVSVFYDSAEQDRLWGKDLYQHLQEIYRDRARFCVVLASRHYARKRWTRHDLRQAQERAFQENAEYILPVRIDGTKVPGLNMTTGYLDLREIDVELVAGLLLSKLGKMSLGEIDPDRLYWNGRFVTYRGQRVASYWPKKIRQSQKLTTVQLTFDRI